jgi:hypothetical protein
VKKFTFETASGDTAVDMKSVISELTDDDDDEAVDKLARMSPGDGDEKEREEGTARRGRRDTVLLKPDMTLTGKVAHWFENISSSSSASSTDSSDELSEGDNLSSVAETYGGLDFLLSPPRTPRAGGDDDDDDEKAFTFDKTRRNTLVFADDHMPAGL